MAKFGDLVLTGKSGKQYTFEVWPINEDFNAVAAVYQVTRGVTDTKGVRNHTSIYIGQTDNLEERFANHHKADCFAGKSANCICTHLDGNEKSRLAKEKDLIAAYNPPCND